MNILGTLQANNDCQSQAEKHALPPSSDETTRLLMTSSIHARGENLTKPCLLIVFAAALCLAGLFPFAQNELLLLQQDVGHQTTLPDEVLIVPVRLDPELTCTVYDCVDLLYTGGPDTDLDRPGFLRAASSMQWITNNRLAIVQDDLNFIALVDIEVTGHDTSFEEPPFLRINSAHSIALPSNHGYRQFSESRGNKNMKLDLEASVYIPKQWSPLKEGFFMGFGSGSSPYRNVIILVRDSLLLSHTHENVDFQPVNTSYWSDYCGRAVVSGMNSSSLLAFYAPSLYQSMRDHTAFSGSELNVEGAAFIPGYGRHPSRIRFFQRGNGAADPEKGLLPKSATAEVLAEDLFRYMDSLLVSDGQNPLFYEQDGIIDALPPILMNVLEYNLGNVRGVPLTFTGSAPSTNDLFTQENEFVYIAGAESSPDSTRDGAVVGTAMGFVSLSDFRGSNGGGGMIAADPFSAVYNFLTYPNGTKFLHKTEGVTVPFGTGVFGDATKIGSALTVLDMDNPNIPSQMCIVLILKEEVSH